MTKNRWNLCLIISSIYLVITTCFDIDCLLSNLIMAIALCITLRYIYNSDESAFSIENFLCIVGLYVGIFSRYFVDIMDSSHVTEFAPYPLQGTVIGHIKTSIVVLLFVCAYAFSYRYKRSKSLYSYLPTDDNKDAYIDTCISSTKCVVAYIFIEIICIGYRILNMRVSTNLDYGTFDQMFRLISSVGKIFAYSYLYLFSRNKSRKAYLLLFMIYVIPTLYISFVSAWKGTIFIEIIMIGIVFHTGTKKIKRRYIVLLIIGIVFVFPIIGMIRDSYHYGVTNSYSISNLIKYNQDHDFLYYYIKRFPYYDGLYYSINVDQSIVHEYNNQAGSIISRFFSGIIPRIIWKDKPIVNVGSYVTYVLLRYPTAVYNNLTVGFLADAYLDGKVLAVFISGLFYGYLVGANHNRKTSKKDSLSSAYYLVLGQALFNYWEGDIAAKTLNLIFAFLAYVIAKAIIDHRITLPYVRR